MLLGTCFTNNIALMIEIHWKYLMFISQNITNICYKFCTCQSWQICTHICYIMHFVLSQSGLKQIFNFCFAWIVNHNSLVEWVPCTFSHSFTSGLLLQLFSPHFIKKISGFMLNIFLEQQQLLNILSPWHALPIYYQLKKYELDVKDVTG